MSEQELQDLKAAYNAVFDEQNQIKACGRDACIHLISLMKKYTSADVGDEETGNINIEIIKKEYFRILLGFTAIKSRVMYIDTIFTYTG